MHTSTDLKSKLIEHLMAMDLSSLSMIDLSSYTGIVCQMLNTEKEDYMTALTKMVANTGFAGRNVEKEAESDG